MMKLKANLTHFSFGIKKMKPKGLALLS